MRSEQAQAKEWLMQIYLAGEAPAAENARLVLAYIDNLLFELPIDAAEWIEGLYAAANSPAADHALTLMDWIEEMQEEEEEEEESACPHCGCSCS